MAKRTIGKRSGIDMVKVNAILKRVNAQADADIAKRKKHLAEAKQQLATDQRYIRETHDDIAELRRLMKLTKRSDVRGILRSNVTEELENIDQLLMDVADDKRDIADAQKQLTKALADKRIVVR